MGFNSIDIVKGDVYTNDFYLKMDDGIFNRTLEGSNGTFAVYEMDTDVLIFTAGLAVDIAEEGFNKAVVTLSAGQTMLLDKIVEDAEDQYLKRSGYWGKVTLNEVPGGPNPILAIVNKINVL